MKFIDVKKRGMDEAGTLSLLERAETGELATVGEDGRPYVVPVCFVFDGGRIYVHCAMHGKKLDNIKANGAVCFSAYEVLGLGVKAEKPCDSWTYFNSVVASGTAHIVEDRDKKMRALRRLSEKYAKGPVGEMPDGMIEKTCVIEIVIDEVSGKKNEKKNAIGSNHLSGLLSSL